MRRRLTPTIPQTWAELLVAHACGHVRLVSYRPVLASPAEVVAQAARLSCWKCQGSVAPKRAVA